MKKNHLLGEPIRQIYAVPLPQALPLTEKNLRELWQTHFARRKIIFDESIFYLFKDMMFFPSENHPVADMYPLIGKNSFNTIVNEDYGSIIKRTFLDATYILIDVMHGDELSGKEFLVPIWAKEMFYLLCAKYEAPDQAHIHQPGSFSQGKARVRQVSAQWKQTLGTVTIGVYRADSSLQLRSFLLV